MATPTERVENAEKLLDKARTYTANSPVRLALLTEAQVELMLAFATPPKLEVPDLDLSPEEVIKLAQSPILAVPEEPAEAAPKKITTRRTRKATPAKEAEK